MLRKNRFKETEQKPGGAWKLLRVFCDFDSGTEDRFSYFYSRHGMFIFRRTR